MAGSCPPKIPKYCDQLTGDPLWALKIASCNSYFEPLPELGKLNTWQTLSSFIILVGMEWYPCPTEETEAQRD